MVRRTVVEPFSPPQQGSHDLEVSLPNGRDLPYTEELLHSSQADVKVIIDGAKKSHVHGNPRSGYLAVTRGAPQRRIRIPVRISIPVQNYLAGASGRDREREKAAAPKKIRLLLKHQAT